MIRALFMKITMVAAEGWIIAETDLRQKDQLAGI